MNTTKSVSEFIEKYKNQLSTEAIKDLKSIDTDFSYLEKIFEYNPCTISLVDENGVYLKTNQSMNAMFKEEVIGKRIGELTKDNTIPEMIKEMREKGLVAHYKMLEFMSVDDEKKYFFIRINTVGSKFLIMGSDLTQMKNMEQEKEFNEKMIFLGEMSSFIIHEINNPLSTISMSNEMLQISDSDPKEAEVYHNQIQEMVETISKIIESLRTFSQKQDHKRPILVKDIYEKSRIILGSKIRKSKVNVSSVNLDGIEFEGNALDFIQVFVNLISNSLDAVEGLNEKWVKVQWENNALQITDSGNGIPDQVVQNLFQKFYTSKGTQGTGIGLHLSQTILNKWGYDINYALINNHTSFVLRKIS
jgi:PAS domain S-box-containing protein